ncbi:MAG: bifunctional class I SAM-dependent methyltransferase/glycosyltransferase family 2 protein [Bacteroidota bacterium]
MNYRDYFDRLASERSKKRKRHWYYWDDISAYCNYFSHETFSILEIGCGTGELLSQVKARKKTGIDFSEAMITEAKKQFPDLELYVMEAEHIILTEKYDLIVISNLIGYSEDVQKVFEQLHHVCHEQTKIIINYHNHLWSPLIKMAEGLGLKTKSPNVNWLTGDDVKNLLMLSGFDCYRQTRRMLFPIYIPLLSTFINRYLAKLPLFRLMAMCGYSFAKPASLESSESTQEKYSVSIIIPARNESGNIENGLLRIPKFGKWQEIIFIEGNSTDDTWETVQKVHEKYKDQYRIKIDKQSGKGKNDAVRKGFSIAEGDILMILDADLTVPPEDLPKFYDAIATNKGSFINGCRLVYPMEKEAMRFLNMLGNKFFSIAFTWLLDQPFKDTLCGTKVIFAEDYKRLVTNRSFFGDFDPFGDYDLIFGAYKLNLKIVELPIRYRERTYGSTNISRFKHGVILLRMCAFAARKIKFV